MTKVIDTRGVHGTSSFQTPYQTEQLFIPAAYTTGGSDIVRSEFSFQTVVSTLFRYRWFIAIVSLSTLVISGLLTFTQKIEPTYRSQAMVSVGQYIPPIVGPTGQLLRETTSARSYIADQLPLITSYTIAELVMKYDPAILEYIETGVLPADLGSEASKEKAAIDINSLVNAEFVKKANSETSDPSSKTQIGLQSKVSLATLQAYLRLIDYEHVSNTSMVAITAEANRPALAARIANIHAQVFIALVQAKLLENARVNLRFLQKRKEEAKEKSEKARKALIAYAEENNILINLDPRAAHAAGMADAGTMLAIEYRDLAGRLTAVTQARAQAESEHRALQASASGGGRFYAAQHDRDLAMKLANAKAELQALKKSGIRGGNPYYDEVQRQERLLEDIINADRKNELKDKEISLRALRDQERLMQEAMKGLKERSQRESKTQMRYTVLAQEDRAAQDLLRELTTRLEEVYIHLNGNQSHVRMIDEARAPQFSRAKLEYINLILGAILGPFIGVALAFAFDLLDNTVRTVSDLQRVVNVPMLGIIPRFSLELDEMIASSFEGLPEGGQGYDSSSITGMLDGSQLPGLSPSPEGVDTDQSPSVLVGGPSLAGAWSTHVREKLEVPDAPQENGKTVIGAQSPAATSAGMGGGTEVSDALASPSGPDTMIGQQPMGGLPSDGDDRGSTIITSSSLVLVSAPHSVESEAFRNVRTCVTYGCTENPPKLVLVTSGQKSDGKTTVACNLAISLAQVSERTLLIDADLRLPAIHKNFSLSRLTPGLSDYLRGNRDYGEVIFETPIPNLCLMLAGEPCPNPTELVGSKRMAELLELLTDEFDHIIIDSPPVTRVADAMLLSRLVEGVVLVVRSGKTPEPVAQSAFQRLRQMDANILGTVLNDVIAVPGYRDAEYYYLSESYYGPDSYGVAEEEEGMPPSAPA